MTLSNRIYLQGHAGIRSTPEYHRISTLPRRVWTEQSAQALSDLLTPLLRRADASGTMQLKPIQAQALHDIGTNNGGFLPIRVGGGKTLISLLAAYVLNLRRPILLIPATLKQKTKTEMRALCKEWRIPFERLRIESYEQLSTPGSQWMLEQYQPDGLILDECHKVKNPRAAVTKRVVKYVKGKPNTIVVGMSGTITKRSPRDYEHIARWCLKERTPLPAPYNEMEEWAQALDESTRSVTRIHPGVLLDFATPEDLKAAEGDPVRAARLGFRRRLVETPGIVATTEGFAGASIYLNTETITKFDPAIEASFQRLRDEAVTPDGWPLTDGLSLFRHARELALGFYYRWNPRPPEEWLQARKIWAWHIREILKHPPPGTHIDSEFLATKAVHDGVVRDPDAKAARELWRKIEPTFAPNTEAVWLDDTALTMAVEWLEKHPKGICWVEHQTVGERLSKLSKRPYFGAGGLDRERRPIENATGPIIAGVHSNATGRNLQAWCDNYVLSCPPNGLQWEQMLGRTHRDHQEADTVSVTVLLSCIEHYDALDQAITYAKYIQDSTGQAQKLLYADMTRPSYWDIVGLPSRRFQK